MVLLILAYIPTVQRIYGMTLINSMIIFNASIQYQYNNTMMLDRMWSTNRSYRMWWNWCFNEILRVRKHENYGEIYTKFVWVIIVMLNAKNIFNVMVIGPTNITHAMYPTEKNTQPTNSNSFLVCWKSYVLFKYIAWAFDESYSSLSYWI